MSPRVPLLGKTLEPSVQGGKIIIAVGFSVRAKHAQ